MTLGSELRVGAAKALRLCVCVQHLPITQANKASQRTNTKL